MGAVHINSRPTVHLVPDLLIPQAPPAATGKAAVEFAVPSCNCTDGHQGNNNSDSDREWNSTTTVRATVATTPTTTKTRGRQYPSTLWFCDRLGHGPCRRGRLHSIENRVESTESASQVSPYMAPTHVSTICHDLLWYSLHCEPATHGSSRVIEVGSSRHLHALPPSSSVEYPLTITAPPL